jgi:hypothetical protein
MALLDLPGCGNSVRRADGSIGQGRDTAFRRSWRGSEPGEWTRQLTIRIDCEARIGVGLVCYPKPEPDGMRVSEPREGQRRRS